MLAHAETVCLATLVAVFYWVEFLTFSDLNGAKRFAFSLLIAVMFATTIAWMSYILIRQTLLGYASRKLNDFDGSLADGALHDVFLSRVKSRWLRGMMRVVLVIFLRPDRDSDATEDKDEDEGYALSKEIHVKNNRLKKAVTQLVAYRKLTSAKVAAVMRLSNRHLGTRLEPSPLMVEAAVAGVGGCSRGMHSLRARSCVHRAVTVSAALRWCTRDGCARRP